MFKYIMEEFIKQWKLSHPSLDYFRICDDLSRHDDYHIVSTALMYDIHIYSIIAGSCHWFQIHDHLSLVTLKKIFFLKNFDILAFSTFSPKKRRTTLDRIFYEAKTYVCDTNIIAKSFEQVRFWTWNLEKKFQMCEKYIPVVSEGEESSAFEMLAEAIKALR